MIIIKPGTWISLKLLDKPVNHKTDIWEVNGTGPILGLIKWLPHWEEYVFFSNKDMVFASNCLRDIADFCIKMTREYKETRKLENEKCRA